MIEQQAAVDELFKHVLSGKSSMVKSVLLLRCEHAVDDLLDNTP